MAPYSSPAPSFRSIQYRTPIRSLVLNWASAQLFPAFSSPSRRMHGHGTRPVGLRVFRPAMAMMCSLPTRGRCRPESYERVPTLSDRDARGSELLEAKAQLMAAQAPWSASRSFTVGVNRRPPRCGTGVGRSPAEPVGHGGVPAAGAGGAHGLAQCPRRTDQDPELLGAGDRGV